MSTIQSCTVCQESLKDNSLAGTYSFPCPGAHKIHQSCLVRWADTVHLDHPEAKTLNCPECREVTNLPTKHSTEQISIWVKTSRKVTIGICTILGLGIGLWIARSSFAGEISKIALKTLHVSPSLVFSAAGGALGFLGSYFLISSNGESRLTKVVTASYNRIYGTEILTRDIAVFQGFSSIPKDDQLQVAQSYFITFGIEMFKTQLEQIPFNEEELQALEQLNSLLQSLETDPLTLADAFFEELEENHGDLYAEFRNHNVKLIQSTGNAELKRTLNELIHKMLCQTLATLDTQTALDSKMSARITLVKILEGFKAVHEEDAKCTELLDSLQEECRNSKSTLITDLEGALPQNFFQQPLTLLLWDTDKTSAVLVALNQIRKTQFEEAGLSF